MNISTTANSAFFPNENKLFGNAKESKDCLFEDVVTAAKPQLPKPEKEATVKKSQLNAAVIEAMSNLF